MRMRSLSSDMSGSLPEDESIWTKHSDVSVSVLNVSTRGLLAKLLNPPLLSTSAQGVQQDWEGLAELAGFDYVDIQNFKLKEDRFKAMFDHWGRQLDATLGVLGDFLLQMERYDILEEQTLAKNIERDVKKYNIKVRQQERERQREEMKDSTEVAERHVTDHMVDEHLNITLGEVETGKPEFFDAFVCAAPENFSFVRAMMHMIEGEYGLKLCVLERDLMPGAAKYTSMAKLISDRCKKMVIVLSPEYLLSPRCDFQTKYAQALSPGSRSKKLIPVIVGHPCSVPSILNFINPLDFTRSDLHEWFWRKLSLSLQEDVPDVLSEEDLLKFDSSLTISVRTLSKSELEAPSQLMRPQQVTQVSSSIEMTSRSLPSVANNDSSSQESLDASGSFPCSTSFGCSDSVPSVPSTENCVTPMTDSTDSDHTAHGTEKKKKKKKWRPKFLSKTKN